METENWTPWEPPYDPRMCDGAIVTQDARGRYIDSPDCGQRCAGCGLCCQGYRDTPDDFEQTEDFMANFQPGPITKLENGSYYRPGPCGPDCPGYGRCCPPEELRTSPTTLSEACQILFEREDSRRWEIQTALSFLAHEGTSEAVALLHDYLPQAHTKVFCWADLALEECEYLASVPRTPEEARLMRKREVLANWEDRLCEIITEIEENLEPALERRQYEYEIAQQILAAAEDEEQRKAWEIQTAVFHDMIIMAQARLEEAEQECTLCETMIVAIEDDLDADAQPPPPPDEIPF